MLEVIYICIHCIIKVSEIPAVGNKNKSRFNVTCKDWLNYFFRSAMLNIHQKINQIVVSVRIETNRR